MDHLTTPQLLGLTLAAIAAFLTAVATWVATQALFPSFIRTAQQQYGKPLPAFCLGAAVVIPAGLLCWWCWRTGQGCEYAGLALATAVLAVSLGGSAGLARRIGSGMMHPTDKDQPWRRTLRGGTVLATLLLAPGPNLVAAFLILSTGSGATLLALREARKRRLEEEREEVDDADSADE